MDSTVFRSGKLASNEEVENKIFYNFDESLLKLVSPIESSDFYIYGESLWV